MTTPFVQFPTKHLDLLREARVKPETLAVYVSILRRTLGWRDANGKPKLTDAISFSQIAADWRIGDRAIAQALAELAEVGLIEVARSARQTNRIRLFPEAGALPSGDYTSVVNERTQLDIDTSFARLPSVASGPSRPEGAEVVKTTAYPPGVSDSVESLGDTVRDWTAFKRAFVRLLSKDVRLDRRDWGLLVKHWRLAYGAGIDLLALARKVGLAGRENPVVFLVGCLKREIALAQGKEYARVIRPGEAINPNDARQVAERDAAYKQAGIGEHSTMGLPDDDAA